MKHLMYPFMVSFDGLWELVPSGPCAAWNILLWTRNGLEPLGEELGMMEDLLLLMGERGGGPGVGGLCPEQGGGMGMAVDKDGGVEEEQAPGIGSPFPLQVQQRES